MESDKNQEKNDTDSIFLDGKNQRYDQKFYVIKAMKDPELLKKLVRNQYYLYSEIKKLKRPEIDHDDLDDAVIVNSLENRTGLAPEHPKTEEEKFDRYVDTILLRRAQFRYNELYPTIKVHKLKEWALYSTKRFVYEIMKHLFQPEQLIGRVAYVDSTQKEEKTKIGICPLRRVFIYAKNKERLAEFPEKILKTERKNIDAIINSIINEHYPGESVSAGQEIHDVEDDSDSGSAITVHYDGTDDEIQNDCNSDVEISTNREHPDQTNVREKRMTQKGEQTLSQTVPDERDAPKNLEGTGSKEQVAEVSTIKTTEIGTENNMGYFLPNPYYIMPFLNPGTFAGQSSFGYQPRMMSVPPSITARNNQPSLSFENWIAKFATVQQSKECTKQPAIDQHQVPTDEHSKKGNLSKIHKKSSDSDSDFETENIVPSKKRQRKN